MEAIMPNREDALKNTKFHADVMESFYSSQEFEDALDDFLDENWDALVGAYWGANGPTE
jgi:hypothetical protein